MSATNVQPANLVQSNQTRVTVSFTTAITVPADGKIKVIFPSGFDVSGANNGSCGSMTGGFLTSVSGQTVTITRNGAGVSEPAAAETCTLDAITNPSATGTTGNYTIRTTNGSDATLEEDLAVAADTIIAPGTLTATNVQPENLIAGIRSRYTVSFTTINTLHVSGRIEVTFPAGFNVAGANSATCSSMDDGFTTATSGQTVIITRNGLGTAQAAAAETCTINGIVAPGVGSGGTYTIKTLDPNGNTTDQDTNVAADDFIAPLSLTATNVQPASLVAGALSTVTVSFTTPSSTPIYARVRVTFPAGYDISAAGVLACATLSGGVTFTTSSNILLISRTGSGSTEAPGVESCTITNIRNPQVSGSTGTYSIEVLDDQDTPATIESDLAVAADTITAGVLTATNVQPENLVVNITSVNTVNFTTANPLPANGKISINYPAAFNISNATSAACVGDGIDGTYGVTASGTLLTITRNGSVTVPGGSALQCLINDIVSPTSTGAGGTYTISTLNASESVIDTATAAADTFVAAPALTATNVQPYSLVQNVTGDHAVTFTTAQNIPAEGKIKIIYGAGYDVSGATNGNCTGFDGSVTTTVSGQTVTLVRSGGTLSVAAAKICTVYGVKNPAAAGSTGTYTITVTDKSDATVATLATVTADTIVAAGAVTATDVQPASLVAGATSTITFVFTTALGLPSNGRIKVIFPSAFNLSAASNVGCAGFIGGHQTTVAGNTITITRDNSASGLASGSVSCNISNIKNPEISGSTGLYTIETRDIADVLIASAAAAADTITAGVIGNIQIQPGTTLVSANSPVAVDFTPANPLPANGKIVINFPVGYNLTAVTTTSLSCSPLTGTLTSSVAGNTLNAVRSGGVTSTAGTALTCVLSDLTNPATTGTSAGYVIRTTTSADVTIDENTSVPGTPFSASTVLTSTSIQPASLYVSAHGSISISFTQALGIPSNGKIRITFPGGFNVSAASGGSCSTMDGSFTTAVVGSVVTLTRSGGTNEPAGAQACTLSNVTNPTVTGNTGTYGLATLTATNQTIEQDLAVPGNVIVDLPAPPTPVITGGGGGGGSYVPITLPVTTLTAPVLNIQQNLENLARLSIPVHGLVKAKENSAVYYIGGDGLRHAFSNDKVFFTWYCNFSQVRIVPLTTLAAISLGKNITYRPGYRMVKFTTDPKVYTVSKGGVLRPIKDEATAIALYGPEWNKKIDDVSEAFYTNYSFGPEIASATDYIASEAISSVDYPSDSLSIPGYVTGLGTTFSCPATSVIKPNIPADFRFTRNLSSTSPSSLEIRYLQEFLKAQGSEIYPEGRVTGNYGPATLAAVGRFQVANGLTKDGLLGNATREKINAILDRLFH